MVSESFEEIMPTYDYECSKCHHKEEHMHGMNDNLTRYCSICKHILIRLIGKGSGVHFKGTGFYETDYKRKKE